MVPFLPDIFIIIVQLGGASKKSCTKSCPQRWTGNIHIKVDQNRWHEHIIDGLPNTKRQLFVKGTKINQYVGIDCGIYSSKLAVFETTRAINIQTSGVTKDSGHQRQTSKANVHPATTSPRDSTSRVPYVCSHIQTINDMNWPTYSKPWFIILKVLIS